MSKEPLPEAEIKNQMKSDYPLIPMSEITTEARLLAVAWVDGYEYQGMDIPGKQKLASDIMNYARRQSATLQQTVLEQKAEIERLSRIIGFAHQSGWSGAQTGNYTIMESWEDFKAKHNL